MDEDNVEVKVKVKVKVKVIRVEPQAERVREAKVERRVNRGESGKQRGRGRELSLRWRGERGGRGLILRQ